MSPILKAIEHYIYELDIFIFNKKNYFKKSKEAIHL